jgi:hypothetical protein
MAGAEEHESLPWAKSGAVLRLITRERYRKVRPGRKRGGAEAFDMTDGRLLVGWFVN